MRGRRFTKRGAESGGAGTEIDESFERERVRKGVGIVPEIR